MNKSQYRKTYEEKQKAKGLCAKCIRPVNQARLCKKHLEKGRIQFINHSRQLKELCLSHYGGKCACCGENRIPFLTIDHINGNGNVQRKALFGSNVGGTHMYRWLIKHSYPSGFQILCMNCNFATRYRNICPHNIE